MYNIVYTLYCIFCIVDYTLYIVYDVYIYNYIYMYITYIIYVLCVLYVYMYIYTYIVCTNKSTSKKVSSSLAHFCDFEKAAMAHSFRGKSRTLRGQSESPRSPSFHMENPQCIWVHLGTMTPKLIINRDCKC